LSQRLFYQDAYQTGFSAHILQHKTIDEHPAVLLDQTCFYPTSGGQMHDTGSLNGIAVMDVHAQNNDIWHLLASPLTGDQVQGHIDWPRRFDFMQQHTAFHILAGSVAKLFDTATLASHLGEQVSTIEIAMKELSGNQLKQLEEMANSVVWENRRVSAYFVSAEEATERNIRKALTGTGPFRLVEVFDFDLDPCGGTHVNSTGQVGLIKIISKERLRGHLRLFFVAGRRAWLELEKYQAILVQIGSRFTTGIGQLVENLDKLLIENKELRKNQQKQGRLLVENSLADLCAKAKERPIVAQVFNNVSMEDLRWLASAAVKGQSGIYLLAAISDQVYLVFSSSELCVDLRIVLQKVLPMINGKGGGEAGFVQAGGEDSSRIAETLQNAEDQVRQQLNLKPRETLVL
jgi:alanyl-tRNA synthetase